MSTLREKFTDASLEQIAFFLLPIAFVLGLLFIMIGLGIGVATGSWPRRPAVIDLRDCGERR